MAVFEQTRSAPVGAVATLRVVEMFETVVKSVKAKFVADRAYGELSKLSAAQLRDIGLGEHDLSAFCRDIARRSL